MSVSQVFAGVGVSEVLRVRSRQSATIALTVAGGETFAGVLALQVGTSPDGPWVPAQDANGADLGPYDEIDGPVTVTAFNPTPKTQYLRVSVPEYDGDNVTATLDEVAGERVAVLLRDNEGVPLAWVLDGGGVEFSSLYVVNFQGGGGVGISIINPTSSEYLTTNGDTPTALGIDIFESRLVTGGSAGNEAVTLGTDAYFVGQRKLITVIGITDPADVVVFDHASFLGLAGEELDGLTVVGAALNAYLLVEFTGTQDALGPRWQIIRVGENVTVTPA